MFWKHDVFPTLQQPLASCNCLQYTAHCKIIIIITSVLRNNGTMIIVVMFYFIINSSVPPGTMIHVVLGNQECLDLAFLVTNESYKSSKYSWLSLLYYHYSYINIYISHSDKKLQRNVLLTLGMS